MSTLPKAEILIKEWLKTIGLELKSSKTKISHSLNPLKEKKPGFDFLGFTIRQHTVKQGKKTYKLLIKPSRNSIKRYTLTAKYKLKEMCGEPQEAIIKT